MHEYYLILKGENKKLAKLEFETLWKTYFDEDIVLEHLKNIYFRFSSNNLINEETTFLSRLTYTNFIGFKLFEGNFEDFSNEMLTDSIPIKEYDGKKFCVKIKRIGDITPSIAIRYLAKPIWDFFKDPKVDLTNYDVEFDFIYNEDPQTFVFTRKIYENNKDYLTRMPKLRPVAMPYTLKSDMARASINYLGLKEGIVLDPFCGIGGILLEACDMGFEIIGNDISWNDLKYMKKNFEHYFPNAKYHRILADSRFQFLRDNTVDGIVTDIPYGRASRRLGDDIYEMFLRSAKGYLKPGGRLVVIYANFVEFKDIALKYFNYVDEIDEYINKSMTRHILILKNNK